MFRRWRARWRRAVLASRRVRSSRRMPPRVAGVVGVEERSDRRQRQLEVPERGHGPRRRDLVAAVAPVAGCRVHVGGLEHARLVVVPEGADRQPGEPREAADGEQVVVHVGHREPSTYPRVKRELSGVVQLAADGPQDEARGLRRLAAELLAVVLLQGQREVARASPRAPASSRARPRRTPRRARRPPVARSRPRGPAPPSAPGRLPARRRPPGPCSATSAAPRAGPLGHLASRPRPAPVRRRPSAAARSCQRVLRHSGSRTLMCSSSHHRPSRQIASRARPSVTNPTRRYARMARSLNANTDSATRCSPRDSNAWSTISRVASLP